MKSLYGMLPEDVREQLWCEENGYVYPVQCGLPALTIRRRDGRCETLRVSTAYQAEALLRGLLRWKLETAGPSFREGTIDALKRALKELTWESERSR